MTEVQAKPVSKAEVAKKIFDDLHLEGADLGGKTIRACFIARAMAEAGLTKNGASTYYQNFMNESRGRKRYSYTPSRKKEVASPEAGADLPGVTKADVKAAEESVKSTVDTSGRWHVLNEAGEVIGSYSSRTKARNAAGEGHTVRDTATA